jgi:hypothetical protein
MKKVFLMMAIAISTISLSFAQSKADVNLNEVLRSYFDLKNALATDKADDASAKAKTLVSKIALVPVKALPIAQQKLYTEQVALIKVKANQLAKSKNIKTQRKSFEGISYPMIKLVKGIKFNDKIVYLQHCPMAKASWLNEKENVENPYYGSMMFDCGDVAETLKAK